VVVSALLLRTVSWSTFLVAISLKVRDVGRGIVRDDECDKDVADIPDIADSVLEEIERVEGFAGDEGVERNAGDDGDAGDNTVGDNRGNREVGDNIAVD